MAECLAGKNEFFSFFLSEIVIINVKFILTEGKSHVIINSEKSFHIKREVGFF